MKNQGCLLMAEGGRGLDINRQSLLRNPNVFCRRSLSLWAGLTDWQSLTKLETGLQVELQMTELLALDKIRYIYFPVYSSLHQVYLHF